MTYDAGNRQDIRKLEKAARRADREDGAVMVNVMANKAGRAFMWRWLEKCHVFNAIDPSDALAMAYAEGQRNQGLAVLNEIMRWCPDQFIQAMREANERRSQLDNTDRDNGNSGSREYGGSEEPGRDDSRSDGDTGDGDDEPDGWRIELERKVAS